MQTLTSVPRGCSHPDHRPAEAIVARIERDGLRIAHVRDIVEAKQLEREWLAGDYSHNAGRISLFKPLKKAAACAT